MNSPSKQARIAAMRSFAVTLAESEPFRFPLALRGGAEALRAYLNGNGTGMSETGTPMEETTPSDAESKAAEVFAQHISPNDLAGRAYDCASMAAMKVKRADPASVPRIYRDPRFIERLFDARDDELWRHIPMIYGGTAPPVPIPEAVIVRIGFRDGITEYCSGTVITKDNVLTSRHCILKSDAQGKEIEVTRIEVGFGDSTENAHYVTAKIAKKAPREIDLALLAIDNGPNIPPACLATKRMMNQLAEVFAVGFGRSEGNGGGERLISCCPLVVVSRLCKGMINGKTDEKEYGCRPGIESVVGSANGTGICNGDSGGPAYLLPSSDSSSVVVTPRYLVGINKAVAENGACGEESIIVRLDGQARAWLNDAVGDANKLCVADDTES